MKSINSTRYEEDQANSIVHPCFKAISDSPSWFVQVHTKWHSGTFRRPPQAISRGNEEILVLGRLIQLIKKNGKGSRDWSNRVKGDVRNIEIEIIRVARYIRLNRTIQSHDYLAALANSLNCERVNKGC